MACMKTLVFYSNYKLLGYWVMKIKVILKILSLRKKFAGKDTPRVFPIEGPRRVR